MNRAFLSSRRTSGSALIYFVTAIIFLYAIYSLFRIATTFAPDFSVFYDAARGLLARQNIYQLPMYTGLGYPPFTLLPFLPFTILPYPVAQTVWVGLSFLLFLASIYLSLLLVRKKVAIGEFCTVFIFAFLAFPTKFTLGMGQVNFAALSLLLLSLRMVQKKKVIGAGFTLGLLFIVKPHFLLFLPLLLLAGEWSAAGISLAVLTVSIALTGVLFGWSLYQYYIQITLPPLLIFAGRSIYYNQGLGSFLSRILPIPLAGELTTWISLLLGIGACWYIRRRGIPVCTSVILLIPVFLLIEPLSWQHHYIFMLPVFVWLVYKVKMNIGLLLLTLLSYVLIAVNIRNPLSLMQLPFAGLILSHVFFGNVLLLSLVLHETA